MFKPQIVEKFPVDSIAQVQGYLDGDWLPIPLKPDSDQPNCDGWGELCLTEETIADFFDDNSNIGVQLGQRSAGLTCLHLCTDDGARAAEFLAPPSGSRIGREGDQHSTHLLYDTPLAWADNAPRSVAYSDPTDDKTLVEVLIGGGAEPAYVVVPPSVVDQERLQWDAREHEFGTLNEAPEETLLESAKLIALVTLLAKHWPQARAEKVIATQREECTMASQLAKVVFADPNDDTRINMKAARPDKATIDAALASMGPTSRAAESAAAAKLAEDRALAEGVGGFLHLVGIAPSDAKRVLQCLARLTNNNVWDFERHAGRCRCDMPGNWSEAQRAMFINRPGLVTDIILRGTFGVPVMQCLQDWFGFDPDRKKDDNSVATEQQEEFRKQASAIGPKPFQWTDPKSIPPRPWLYGRYLIRKQVSADFAPGGTGKTSHSIVEALAMASGKPLLGITPVARLKVWFWSLEDPEDEVVRRVMAAARHYKLEPEDIGENLFINHGRQTPLVVATQTKNQVLIVEPMVDALIKSIISQRIDVLLVDPFVSAHQVPENDNNAIDRVVKQFGAIADQTNCAIRLTHHTRKQGDGEITAESGRGASALVDASRVVRVFNKMTKEEADQAGIENERRRSYYRTYVDKGNMAPAAERSDWFHLWSVSLDNGTDLSFGRPMQEADSIGVSTSWSWPEALAGVTGRDFEAAAAKIRGGQWRFSPLAKDWVGNAVAEAMNLDPDHKPDKARVKGIVASWIKAGSLLVVERPDHTRHTVKWVEVAENE